MTGNEYQELAMRTNGNNLGYKMQTINAALGLAGEAGEIADSIKKTVFHGHDPDITHIAKELGDVLWYAAQMCDAIGVSMDNVMKLNIEKLSRRYPQGFSSEASINRHE